MERGDVRRKGSEEDGVGGIKRKRGVQKDAPWGAVRLLVDGGTGLAGDAVLGLLQQGDEGGTAGLGLGKLHSGLYLGQHGAGGEMALGLILAGLGGSQVAEPLHIGLAEVDGHLLHCGEDDEGIGIQLLGQQLGGKVLVDDGAGTVEGVALTAGDGDTAAAAGDGQIAGSQQGTDGLDLNDGNGLGRRRNLKPVSIYKRNNASSIRTDNS